MGKMHLNVMLVVLFLKTESNVIVWDNVIALYPVTAQTWCSSMKLYYKKSRIK